MAKRQIIRNGDLNFEVDSFDSSMLQITKIAAEEGGYVSTTDSEKLPNGKVKGTVIVRCPPDRLDTLVLKLRGIGDLKSQKIAAQDITKQYTDIESQLRAGRAMEERLLAVIKDGKGQIKDLLEAEKQLGVWREKIEGLEGEIRYYNNLVSLSTLNVTLFERDIKTPFATSQTETVSMGLEAEDVEKARSDAIHEIEQSKGRIIESDLKKEEASRLSATIIADVAPDLADPLIERLKQIGKVARLDRERRQTNQGGSGTPPPGTKMERQDTRLQISLYNLAGINPRVTSNLHLAAADVEKAYQQVIEQVKAGGGTILESKLNRPKAEQVTATLGFTVPADKADLLSAAIRAGVEVMRLDVVESTETQMVTSTKRGFAISIDSLANVAPRETTTLQIAARSVPEAFNKLLEAARAGGGRIVTSQLSEQDANNVTATLAFDVTRENWAKIDVALREAGLVVTRNVARSAETESTVDSKVGLQVTLTDEARLSARESIRQQVATRGVPQAFEKLLDAVRAAGRGWRSRTWPIRTSRRSRGSCSSPCRAKRPWPWNMPSPRRARPSAATSPDRPTPRTPSIRRSSTTSPSSTNGACRPGRRSARTSPSAMSPPAMRSCWSSCGSSTPRSTRRSSTSRTRTPSRPRSISRSAATGRQARIRRPSIRC